MFGITVIRSSRIEEYKRLVRHRNVLLMERRERCTRLTKACRERNILATRMAQIRRLSERVCT